MRFEDLFEEVDDDDSKGCGHCIYCRMRQLLEDDPEHELRLDLTLSQIAVMTAALGYSMSAIGAPETARKEMKSILDSFKHAFEQQYIGL